MRVWQLTAIFVDLASVQLVAKLGVTLPGVEIRRIELRLVACEATVLPLILCPHTRAPYSDRSAPSTHGR